MNHSHKSPDQVCINSIRFLAVDAVQKAASGHPGAPLGVAPVAYVLWDRFLRHNPQNPDWPDRDRFVLSCGHASALLYALLHLTGYDLRLDEMKRFRQWGSKTPGHPEYGAAPGIEVTTGPLGQGFGNAVGMAISERWLASRFNRPGYDVINHCTYVLASDGDLMEGVASEAASYAGTLGLGKLIALYDDNGITIEGSTGLTFTEDVARRFEAYHWQVIGPLDGNDIEKIDAAIREAKSDSSRPSLIICKTAIGFGSPNQGTAKVHGEPLGEDHVRAAKEKLGWPLEPTFFVPQEASNHLRQAIKRGQKLEKSWLQMMQAYAQDYPDLAEQLRMLLIGDLPGGWERCLGGFFDEAGHSMATRVASGKVLNALAKGGLALLGGSADLGPSNKTILEGLGDHTRENPGGQNLHFGVREHAMGAIANGIARHGGPIPYTGTFLIFSDYMRPPMRLAAMMGLRVLYVFSHDSIGLGEDGPTHQPIEHLMNLRAVPNLRVIRPADALETAEAWRCALKNRSGPTAIILTRQNVPIFNRTVCAPAKGLQRGAYVLWESHHDKPEAILIGTGSEVHIALEAGQRLAGEGVRIWVVSMPCWEIFDEQPESYHRKILPPDVTARLAIEAGITMGWERYVGLDGGVVGLDRFGASAPYPVLYEQFGITIEAAVSRVKELLASRLARKHHRG